MAKAQYSKPASQVDLEARQKKDYVPPTQVQPAQDPTESENGYIGTDPIYQNHANDTEAPIQADGGPESKIFDQHYSEDVDFDATAPSDGEGSPSTQDDKTDSSAKSGGGTAASGAAASPPTGGSTPPSGQNS